MKNLNLVSFCGERMGDVAQLLQAGTDGSVSRQLKRCRMHSPSTDRRRTTSHFKYRVSRNRDRFHLEPKRKERRTEGCRKHRRRPRVILASGNVLGTHMYNAKRMKMVMLWGMKIPQRSSSRGLSAMKAALRDHAVVADNSYLRAIDVSSREMHHIAALLGSYLDVQCGLFENERFLSGIHEAEVSIYTCDGFPHQLLGPATLAVVPTMAHENGDEAIVLVRIWTHPAYFSQLLESLEEKCAETEVSCIVKEQNAFAKFSITGARSLQILQRSICACDSKASQICPTNVFYSRIGKCKKITQKMWPDRSLIRMIIKDVREPFCLQMERAKSLQIENEICPGRIQFPTVFDKSWYSEFTKVSRSSTSSLLQASKKQKEEQISFSSAWEKTGSKGPSWNTSRQSDAFAHENTIVLSEMLTSFGVQIARRVKRNFSVPFGRSCERIDSQLSGFDITFPKVWSADLWRVLIFFGARAIGLDEEAQLDLECGIPNFPKDYLDTEAGREFIRSFDSKLVSKNRILSKSKRKKLPCSRIDAIKSLFFLSTPLGEVNVNDDITFSVVREALYLESFFPPLTRTHHRNVEKFGFLSGRLQLFRSQPCNDTNEVSRRKFDVADIPELPKLISPTCIQIRIEAVGRGVPQSGAEIYSLTAKDYLSYLYYSQNKATAVRSDGSRLGYWQGKSVSALVVGENLRVGVLTSGGQSWTTGARVGLGVCNAEVIYQLNRSTVSIVSSVHAKFLEEHGKINGSCDSIGDELLRIVFFKNPYSKILRVAKFSPVAAPTFMKIG